MKAVLPLVLAAVLGIGLAVRRPALAPAASAPTPERRADASAPPPALSDVRLLALEGLEKGSSDALRARLADEPALWPEVLEVLCAVDDPKAAQRAAESLAPAMPEYVEAGCVELLRSGPTSHARRVAAAALGRRSGAESLGALMAAAREDVDRKVRYDALIALALRRDHAASEAQALAIGDVFRGRAQGEPDAELRSIARRLAGEPAAEDKAPRSASRRRPALR